MLKQDVKTKLNLFEQLHYPNFLLPSSDLMQPRWRVSSLFEVNVKK